MGKDFSIIIPVYFNEGSLSITYAQLKKEVLTEQQLSYELIFIDDGSLDNSLQELLEIRKLDPENIKIVKFTRNFGQVAAIMAGYEISNSKVVINISADLQDPPSLINEMIKKHFSEGYEVVICTRDSREESLFRRLTSRFFYSLIKKWSLPTMPIGGFDYVLISRKVRNLILSHKEVNPFWQGQILWHGFKTYHIPYQRKKREIGKSRWTFSKKIKYLIDGLMAYSYIPIRIISVLGFLNALAGFLYAFVIIFARIFGDVPFKGWAPIMILILVLSGIQMIMLGIIGEYLWRTLDQVRNRQPYVIEQIY
jgi:polyisoprenyl-phosphate glycosyltransferase